MQHPRVNQGMEDSSWDDGWPRRHEEREKSMQETMLPSVQIFLPREHKQAYMAIKGPCIELGHLDDNRKKP